MSNPTGTALARYRHFKLPVVRSDPTTGSVQIVEYEDGGDQVLYSIPHFRAVALARMLLNAADEAEAGHRHYNALVRLPQTPPAGG